MCSCSLAGGTSRQRLVSLLPLSTTPRKLCTTCACAHRRCRARGRTPCRACGWTPQTARYGPAAAPPCPAQGPGSYWLAASAAVPVPGGLGQAWCLCSASGPAAGTKKHELGVRGPAGVQVQAKQQWLQPGCYSSSVVEPSGRAFSSSSFLFSCFFELNARQEPSCSWLR